MTIKNIRILVYALPLILLLPSIGNAARSNVITTDVNPVLTSPGDDPNVIVPGELVEVRILVHGITCIQSVFFEVHYNSNPVNPAKVSFVTHEKGSLLDQDDVFFNVLAIDEASEPGQENVLVFIDAAGSLDPPTPGCDDISVNTPNFGGSDPDAEVYGGELIKLYFRVNTGVSGFINFWPEPVTDTPDPAFANGFVLTPGDASVITWGGNTIGTSEAACGDVTGNGSINVVDAAFVSQANQDRRDLDDRQFAKADVTGNGSINVFDVARIRQYIVGVPILLNTCNPITLSPTANAGEDIRVPTGTQVTLNGSESFDPDGGNLTYSWEVFELPANISTGQFLSGPTPVFSPPAEGKYALVLTVTNPAGKQGQEDVRVSWVPPLYARFTPESGSPPNSSESAVYLEQYSGGVSDEVDVDLRIQNVSGLHAIPFHLSYDPDIVRFVSVEDGTIFNSCNSVNSTSEAFITVDDILFRVAGSYVDGEFLFAGDELVQEFSYATAHVDTPDIICGDTPLPIDDTSFFSVGQSVTINNGTFTAETRTIESIQISSSSLTFTQDFAFCHLDGESVSRDETIRHFQIYYQSGDPLPNEPIEFELRRVSPNPTTLRTWNHMPPDGNENRSNNVQVEFSPPQALEHDALYSIHVSHASTNGSTYKVEGHIFGTHTWPMQINGVQVSPTKEMPFVLLRDKITQGVVLGGSAILGDGGTGCPGTVSVGHPSVLAMRIRFRVIDITTGIPLIFSDNTLKDANNDPIPGVNWYSGIVSGSTSP